VANELVAKFEGQLLEKENMWAPTLPPNIERKRFVSTVMTAVIKTPDLLQADRGSLLLACMQAASAGILPDGREGAIVIFKDWKTKKKMAQFMPMVTGIVRRLRELGDLTSISAYCVYKGDAFEVMLGDDPKIIHKPDPTGSRDGDDIVAAYAIFKNGNEVVHREIMTREEIDLTRGVSRAKDGQAWKQWLGEMARKTVIRRGSKSVPLSAAGAAIIETDDQWVDFSIRDTSAKEIEHNPLEDDDVNQDVVDAEIVDALNDETVVEPPAQEVEVEEPMTNAKKLAFILEKIANIDEAERLEAFLKNNSDKLASLPDPAKGKVRSASRARLKELREMA
jgi:recombination protein RecT